VRSEQPTFSAICFAVLGRAALRFSASDEKFRKLQAFRGAKGSHSRWSKGSFGEIING
jgi:hypothetical protein